MTELKHYKILSQGVDIWNHWRERNPDIKPSLIGVSVLPRNLAGANFRKTDLDAADLTNTDITGAFLYDASIRSANLRNAKLIACYAAGLDIYGSCLDGASLINSDLRGVNFTLASLRSADLHGSNLSSANFTSADLTRANLHDIRLGQTVFANTNLTNTEGLNTCKHYEPSFIDYRTIAQSIAVPVEFLRGCGLPESAIDNVAVLRQNRKQFYSCFISYSSKDEVFAKKLHADLQSHGVRCWFAPEDIQAGKKIHSQITDAIRSHDKLLLILSEDSLNSAWVAIELKRAREREKQVGHQVLFPISIIDHQAIAEWELFDVDTVTDLAAEVRSIFIPDFSNWKNEMSYASALQRLLRDLSDNVAERGHLA